MAAHKSMTEPKVIFMLVHIWVWQVLNWQGAGEKKKLAHISKFGDVRLQTGHTPIFVDSNVFGTEYKIQGVWINRTSCSKKCFANRTVFHILIWTYASRGLNIFRNLSLQKSAETHVFWHFDWEMRFPPQQPHCFDIRTSENGPNPSSRTTRTTNFSTELPNMARTKRCVLYILTWTCASRQNSKFQNWSENVLLADLLRATTAYHCATPELLKLVRCSCFW